MTDWSEYFRNYRKSLEAGEAVIEDESNELLQPMTPTLTSTAPTSPKRMHKRLTEAGWEVWIEHSVVRVGCKFFRDPKHSRYGEVKWEAQDVKYWQLRARRREQGHMVAALLASWEQKKSCTFQNALTWDMVTRDKDLVSTMKELEEWLDILAPKQKAA